MINDALPKAVHILSDQRIGYQFSLCFNVSRQGRSQPPLSF